MSETTTATEHLFVVVMEGPIIHGRPDSPAMRVITSSTENAIAAATARYGERFRVATVRDLGPPRPADQVEEVVQELEGFTFTTLRAEPWPLVGATTQVVAEVSGEKPTFSWPAAGKATLDEALAMVASLNAVIAAAQERHT